MSSYYILTQQKSPSFDELLNKPSAIFTLRSLIAEICHVAARNANNYFASSSNRSDIKSTYKSNEMTL